MLGYPLSSLHLVINIQALVLRAAWEYKQLSTHQYIPQQQKSTIMSESTTQPEGAKGKARCHETITSPPQNPLSNPSWSRIPRHPHQLFPCEPFLEINNRNLPRNPEEASFYARNKAGLKWHRAITSNEKIAISLWSTILGLCSKI